MGPVQTQQLCRPKLPEKGAGLRGAAVGCRFSGWASGKGVAGGFEADDVVDVCDGDGVRFGEQVKPEQR